MKNSETEGHESHIEGPLKTQSVKAVLSKTIDSESMYERSNPNKLNGIEVGKELNAESRHTNEKASQKQGEHCTLI